MRKHLRHEYGSAQHLGRVPLLLWILRCISLLRVALLGRISLLRIACATSMSSQEGVSLGELCSTSNIASPRLINQCDEPAADAYGQSDALDGAIWYTLREARTDTSAHTRQPNCDQHLHV